MFSIALREGGSYQLKDTNEDTTFGHIFFVGLPDGSIVEVRGWHLSENRDRVITCLNDQRYNNLGYNTVFLEPFFEAIAIN